MRWPDNLCEAESLWLLGLVMKQIKYKGKLERIGKYSMLNIKNKTYDVIKKIVAILPLFTGLYVALASVWGWGFGDKVDATVSAIISFLNGILGVFMLASSKAYHKGDTKKKKK